MSAVAPYIGPPVENGGSGWGQGHINDLKKKRSGFGDSLHADEAFEIQNNTAEGKVVLCGECDDEQTCLLGEDWESWFQPQLHERTLLLFLTFGILTIINRSSVIGSICTFSQH